MGGGLSSRQSGASGGATARRNRPNDRRSSGSVGVGGQRSNQRERIQDRRADRRASSAGDTPPDAGNQAWANTFGDDNPDAAWNNYWGGFGIGTGGGSSDFGGSDFSNWFNNDYFDTMQQNWHSAQQVAGAGGDRALHFNEWLGANGNVDNMRTAWANQSNMTRGVPGRAQGRWMTV